MRLAFIAAVALFASACATVPTRPVEQEAHATAYAGERLAPAVMKTLLGAGGFSGFPPGTPVNGAVISPSGVTFAPNTYPQWSDHGGPSSYWEIANITSSGWGNTDLFCVYRTGGTNPYFCWDSSTGYSVSRFGFAVAAANDGSGQLKVIVGQNANAQRVEHGHAAMTTGVLASTFAAAFSAAPDCTCTHVGTTNTNACVITTGAAPTTTNYSFTVTSGGTDVVDWTCVGDR